MVSTIAMQIYMKSGVSFLYFKHFPTQKAILQMQRYELGFFKIFFVFFVFYFIFLFFTFQYSSCISGYANHFYYLYVLCISLIKFFIFFPPFFCIYTFEKDKKMISISNRVFNKRNVWKCRDFVHECLKKVFEIFLILYWLWIIGSTTETTGFYGNTYLFLLHFYSVFLVILTLRKFPL